MRSGLFLLSLALAMQPLLAQEESAPRRWSLELPLSFPEGLGAAVQYESSPGLSLQLFYHVPTPIRVKTQVRSRKLVERDGIMIRSPNIDLPFHVQLGPHYGMGASFRPFGSSFYLMLAWEYRLLTIDSLVQSHLEVIDSQNRMMTHTLFQAEAATRTQQSILRPGMGYRWDIGERDYFFSLYLGWSHPFQAHSSVRTQVRVRNPEASNPADVDARNLKEAEAEQGRVLEQKVMDELQKFESLSLPIFGMSIGKFL
jgi:hypothetical protein